MMIAHVPDTMAYPRKRSKKTLVSLYRRFAGKRSLGAAKKTLVRKVAAAVKRQGELKYFDYANASAAPSTGGSVALLNVIAEGSDTSDRVGRAVRSVFITIDIITYAPSTATNFDTGKIALVYDKSPNGTIAAYADIFAKPAAGGVVSMNMKNICATGERFKILRQWNLPVLQQGGINGTHYVETIRIPNSMSISKWAGSAATTPLEGGFYLVYASLADTHNVATSFAHITQWRYAYVDM